MSKNARGRNCATPIMLGLLALFVVIVVIPKVVALISSGQASAPDPIDGVIACHQFMTKQLKAPSSASFPNAYHETYAAPSSGVVEVDSYVDADNSFGVPVRTNYTCQVRYDETAGAWRLEGLQIAQN